MASSEHDEEHSWQRRRFALLRREWQLSLYPQAAEAGGCLVTMRSGESAGRRADPERAATEANRRARAKVRRYGVANRLNRLATLTYAGEGCFDPVQCARTWPRSSRHYARPSRAGRSFVSQATPPSTRVAHATPPRSMNARSSRARVP